MARTALAPIVAVDEGVVWSLSAANVDGHSIPGGGDIIVFVANASGGNVDVTVQTAATQDGLAVADQVVTVATGTTKAIGPFRPATYDRAVGAADAGKVYVDFASVTSVTCAALQVS